MKYVSLTTGFVRTLALGSAAVLASADCALAAQAQAPASSTQVLPAGTAITLRPTGTGSMANLHNVGDPIDFTVLNAVIVNGWIVVPKGAPAHGTIADLTRSGARFGGKFSQASLKFAFDWVQLAAGKIEVAHDAVEVKGRQLQTKVKTLFGDRNTPQVGIDPFLTLRSTAWKQRPRRRCT